MSAALANLMPPPADKLTCQHSAGKHFARFAFVGAIGVLLQLAVLRFLTHQRQIGYLLATLLAVEITILHNFVWHERFTWRDRPPGGAGDVIARLIKFNASNGGVSLAGNILVMQLMVDVAHLNVLVSNVLAVGCCSVVNFLISDRFIFTDAPDETLDKGP